MTYIDDCTSDTSSILSNLAPSQSASQCVSQTSGINGTHGGENIGLVLQELTSEFGLTETTGYFTADNHDDGDRAI